MSLLDFGGVFRTHPAQLSRIALSRASKHLGNFYLSEQKESFLRPTARLVASYFLDSDWPLTRHGSCKGQLAQGCLNR
jgi:hypothetical protein